MDRFEPAKTPSASLIPADGPYTPRAADAHLEQKRRSSRSATWAFELFCAALSIAAIVAIAAVLRTYDGQSLSSWNLHVTVNADSFNISLNSVISVLGTLAKSTIAVVLTSGLSQIKWNWFTGKRRALEDFELFDSASRGPKGSVQLLWRTRARRLASLGAFLTILSLTLDPFLQLLITYPGVTRPVPDASATLAYAYEYTGGSELGLDAAQIVGPDGRLYDAYDSSTDPDIVGAMYISLWNMNTRLKPTYNCDNGNCTWPPHVSLAVCSSCFDLSQHLTQSQPTNVSYSDGDGAEMLWQNENLMFSLDSTIDLSIVNHDGFSFVASGVNMNMTTTIDPKMTINFQDSQTLLLSLAAIVVDRSYLENTTAWEHTPVSAIECGLMLCSNTYKSGVQNGNFSETTSESQSERVPSAWSVVDTQYKNSSYIANGTTWNPIGPATTYHVNRTDFQVQLTPDQANMAGTQGFRIPQASVDSLVAAVSNIFAPDGGSSSKSSNFSTVTLEEGLLTYDTPTVEALWSGTSINAIFANLATDMSAAVRNAGPSSNSSAKSAAAVASAPNEASKDPNFEPLTGSSSQFDVLISVRWPFITVPVLICGLGLVFLVAAIIETRQVRTPIWKDSALAGLVWGLDDDSRHLAREDWQVTGVASQSKTRVIYRGGKEAGELVQ